MKEQLTQINTKGKVGKKKKDLEKERRFKYQGQIYQQMLESIVETTN